MRIPIDPKKPSIGEMEETIKTNKKAMKEAKETIKELLRTKHSKSLSTLNYIWDYLNHVTQHSVSARRHYG